ncbi:MAG: hypothetical protein J6B71_03570, partial [Clostridia bacterium]|nr:hypothetical protein [Clostridia bacterium]
MQFSLLTASMLGAGLTNTGFLAAIAILACILGAEVAGICILISKMLRARKARYERHDDTDSGTYRNYAAGAFLLFGAIPQASYIALTVLAALAALAAVVFVVLLVIFRLRGYDFAASDWYHEAEARKQDAAQDRQASAESHEAEEYLSPEIDEEQRQEAYTEAEEIVNTEDEPLSAFDEEPITEEDGEAEDCEAAPETVLLPAEAGVTTTTVREVREEPTFADGSQPYKVVEKIVTETVKEVYTETPNPAPTTGTPSNNDAVLEKLVDLLEYEIRGRREAEKNEAAEEGKKKDSVATFAQVELPVDEDEDDEEIGRA